jgi:hypothetical protein
MSILAFCSSIFFVRISICAPFEMEGAGVRAIVCAKTSEAGAAIKKSVAKICAQTFIARDFAICWFFWQARVNLPLPGFPLNFLHAGAHSKADGPDAVGTERRRWRRAEVARYIEAGHERSAEKNAQGGSEPIQALSAAHGRIMETFVRGA